MEQEVKMPKLETKTALFCTMEAEMISANTFGSVKRLSRGASSC